MTYKHGWSDNARLHDGIRKREEELREKYRVKETDDIEDEIINQVRCDECGEFYHADAMTGRMCFNCSESIEDEIE